MSNFLYLAYNPAFKAITFMVVRILRAFERIKECETRGDINEVR